MAAATEDRPNKDRSDPKRRVSKKLLKRGDSSNSNTSTASTCPTCAARALSISNNASDAMLNVAIPSPTLEPEVLSSPAETDSILSSQPGPKSLSPTQAAPAPTTNDISTIIYTKEKQKRPGIGRNLSSLWKLLDPPELSHNTGVLHNLAIQESKAQELERHNHKHSKEKKRHESLDEMTLYATMTPKGRTDWQQH